MALKLTTKKPVAKATATPMLTCPFTGKPIEIKVVGPDAHVMAVVPHLWSSRIFDSKQELIDALMTRNGVEPPWAKRVLSNVVSVPPEDESHMDDVETLRKLQDDASNIK